MAWVAESRPGIARERHLVVGTLDGLPRAERALADLRRVGFPSREIALVACDEGRGDAAPTPSERLGRFGEMTTLACQGLGTLVIVGGVLPIRPLDCRACLHDLGQALIDTGLPDADALIYQLGLIRGRCLIAVVAATPERIHVAYRLLLRSQSGEVHLYRR